MIILIVGMHRSGTSLVARGLAAMGANLGANIDRRPAEGNPHGHWEHADVWTAQERLLGLLGRTWHESVGPLPPDWINWPETQECIARFSALAQRELPQNGHWVVKDPRSSLLLPLWKAVAARCGTELRLVRLLRDGTEVARSLAKRNAMAPAHALAIWREHQRAIRHDGKGLATLEIRHADLMQDPVTPFTAIAQFCGLPAPQAAAQKAARLVDPALWHHRSSDKTRQLAPDELTEPQPPQDRGCVLIVMRARWRQELLARALRSVMSQTYTNWILHIVNDGGPAALIAAEIAPYQTLIGHRIKVTHHTRQHGMEAASNKAITTTDSDFIVIHDDDDSWSPDFLAAMVGFLHRTGAHAAICQSRIVHEIWDGQAYVTQRKEPPLPATARIEPADLAAANMFPPISFLFRRSVFERVGGFHEGLPALGDWHFNRRVAELGAIPVLPEVLAFWHHRDAVDRAPNSLVRSDHIRFTDWVREGNDDRPLPPFFGQMQIIERHFDIAALSGFERPILPAAGSLRLRPGLYLIEVTPDHDLCGPAVLRMQDAQGRTDNVPLSGGPAPFWVLINARAGLAQLALAPLEPGCDYPRPRFDVTRLADPLDSLDTFSRHPRLPDLLCIGAQRSGTTWLHGALQLFAEVWDCPIKEFHHFNSGQDEAAAFRQHQALALLHSGFVRVADAETRSERVRMLLRHAFTPPQSWERYSSLFDAAPADQIVCDFTPAYATLNDPEVAAIARTMPDVKVIFILRDPVDRAISGALHDLHLDGIEHPTEAQVASRCLAPGNLARTDYTQTLRVWTKHLPKAQLLVLFHDDIIEAPARVMEQVRTFLGLPAQEIPSATLANLPKNRHGSLEQAQFDALRTRLSVKWRAQAQDLAHRFGGPAQGWLDRIEARCCVSSPAAKAHSAEAHRPGPPPRQSFAIVLHLFHEDQWPDFADILAAAPTPFSLYVTLAPESTFAPEITSRFPFAIIRKVPNVGRDVAPFLALLDELRDFDLVCKLHTKRDEGAHGAWRAQSVAKLVGNTAMIRAYLEAFAQDPELVLAGPGQFYIDGPAHEMQCHTALHLMHGPIPPNWGFFAGTMFWCRPGFFVDLAAGYPQNIFAPHHDGDGQPEHVVERLFGLWPAQHGKKIMLWDDPPIIAPATEVKGHLDWAAIYAELGHSAQQPDMAPGSSLVALHQGNRGRISDKWRGNLKTYDRLLSGEREKAVRLLEIGVQNGGSLELWARYFRNGRVFLGCDIDPKCGKLTFDDPRIDVIVCDATSPALLTEIAARSAMLDLIIDDGSHRSGDVIQSFTLLFPFLSQDGLYIVEDQHCSY